MAKGMHKGELDRDKLLARQRGEGGGDVEAMRQTDTAGPRYPAATYTTAATGYPNESRYHTVTGANEWQATGPL